VIGLKDFRYRFVISSSHLLLMMVRRSQLRRQQLRLPDPKGVQITGNAPWKGHKIICLFLQRILCRTFAFPRRVAPGALSGLSNLDIAKSAPRICSVVHAVGVVSINACIHDEPQVSRVVTQSTNDLRIYSCRRNLSFTSKSYRGLVIGGNGEYLKRHEWEIVGDFSVGSNHALTPRVRAQGGQAQTRPLSSTTSTEHDFRFPRRPATSLFHEQCPDIALSNNAIGTCEDQRRTLLC
jgi:hypothetical protein